VGLQRIRQSTPEFIGFYHFPEGENDDCGRIIKRIVKCLQQADMVFEDE
jgi:hypothetical protein